MFGWEMMGGTISDILLSHGDTCVMEGLGLNMIQAHAATRRQSFNRN